MREVDEQINQMERNIDEECLRILARRQPAASDLRLIISISKSVIDLERIGDESTKIARRAIQLCEEGESPRGYVEVRHIGDQVRNMVRDALDAFARFDADLALSVAQYDKTIDREYKTALRELVTYMMEDPRSISRVLSVIWVLRSLERIGDHARNISELVIYLVRGTDVRHMGLKRMKAEVEGTAGTRPKALMFRANLTINKIAPEHRRPARAGRLRVWQSNQQAPANDAKKSRRDPRVGKWPPLRGRLVGFKRSIDE